MNKVILLGRLTDEPKTYKNGDNTTVKFNVAVDRRFKSEQSADFPSCVAFGKTAEFVEKYFHKGMKIGLVGRLTTGSYEKDGKKIYTTDVVAEEVEFAESKKTDNPPPSDDGYMYIPENIADDLPFK